jgi:hypothetical protein
MKSRLFLGLLGLTLLVYPLSVAHADCNGTPQAAITASLAPVNASGVTGTATLCIYKHYLYATVDAQNLTVGDAFTTWFMYFDNPANCLTPGACTPNDLFTPADNPEGVLGRISSGLAGRSGALHFLGNFRGLQLSHGSVVHISILDHGAVVQTDGRALARQLMTPQNPALGPPGLGTTSDGVKAAPVAVASFTLP